MTALAELYKKHTNKKTKRLNHDFFFTKKGKSRKIIRSVIRNEDDIGFFASFLPFEIPYDINNENYLTVKEWLGQNCHGAWMPLGNVIAFTHQQDAALFKLWFG